MVAALVFGFLLLLAPPKTVDVVVVTLSRGGLTVPLQPSGRVDLRREPTLTRVSIEIDKLAPPASAAPAMNSYVVWAVSPEGYIENIGELAMDKDKGRLETTTRFDQVGLIITAEPHYMVDRPSNAAVFRTQNPKSEPVRRQPVSIELGAYDYSGLMPEPQGAPVPTIVAEARAAFKIAKNADAERIAENEFRRARAALDTMEQLVSRASPLDIVAESANETIRRSQRAVTIAREKSGKPAGGM
jgi:hypothetical protein